MQIAEDDPRVAAIPSPVDVDAIVAAVLAKVDERKTSSELEKVRAELDDKSQQVARLEAQLSDLRAEDWVVRKEEEISVLNDKMSKRDALLNRCKHMLVWTSKVYASDATQRHVDEFMALMEGIK